MDRALDNLPLAGIRVLELGHAVMGPTCGLILADMGAEVIKIEKAPKGDDTRRLLGFGLGLFPYFNRKKNSLIETTLPTGVKTKLPKLPLRLGDYDFNLRNDAPGVGADTLAVLKSIGLDDHEIEELIDQGIVVFDADDIAE